MGDSWDDDEFEVPAIIDCNPPASAKSKAAWEEEDNLELEQKVQPIAPSPQQIEAAKKKAELEELKLQNQLKFAAEENETPEERKLRERRQVEEADVALAGELFGKVTIDPSNSTPLVSTSSSKPTTTGLGSIPLKTKQEHTNFAILCSKKLSDSTPLNTGVFYKALSDKVKDTILSDTLDEVITTLTKVREDRKKSEAAKAAVAKKSKKQIAAETARHNDVFGGIANTKDEYEHYYGIEDDFM